MDQNLYFFVYYPRYQKVQEKDINFIVPSKKENRPECIYDEEIIDGIGNRKYYKYKKIYKVSSSIKKGNTKKYHFEFLIGDDKYEISFDSGTKVFIFDVNLQVGKNISGVRTEIEQNNTEITEYNQKIDNFIQALEDKGEKGKIDILYGDAINLYENKKGFSFLISLFLKIYEMEDLGPKLLRKFREMNSNPEDNKKNMDRKKYLNNYSSQFEELAEKAEQIIKDKNYNTIEFYGIILCYLNIYKKNSFVKVINDLSSKNSDDIFEILLIYNTHFKNPIKKNFEFFDRFIKYTLNKNDFSKFKIALGYIEDLETFLKVIEENREDIYNKFIKPEKEQKNKENYILKLENDLIFNKEEASKDGIKYPIIIDYIQTILKFCEENNIFLIQFTSDFWNYILNCYKAPISDNIYVCWNLRKVFIDYRMLIVNKLKFDNNSIFVIDVINYDGIDEFAFQLDQIINEYFKKNKQLKDLEKLDILTKYHPYYDATETKYSNKVDTRIFDSLKLSNIDNSYIHIFRNMNFELIFKKNIHNYIDKITSKIMNVSDFENTIKLINFDNIKNHEIITLDYFVKRYDTIVGNTISNLSDSELYEAVNVMADLAFRYYIYRDDGEKFTYIDEFIKEQPEDIQPLIFIEIIKLCINENERKEKFLEEKDINANKMKEKIFTEYSKQVSSKKEINNIVKLIECLQGKSEKLKKEKEKEKEENRDEDINAQENLKKEREKNINEFLEKLIDNNLFSKDEYFSNRKEKNFKIDLIYKLFKEGMIKKNKEKYYNKIQSLLKEIKEDLEGKIKKKKLEEFLGNEESFIKERLGLIQIILSGFNPEQMYTTLKNEYMYMQNILDEFIFIKENIILFYKDTYYKDIIKDLIYYIKIKDKMNISEIKAGKIGELKKKCDDKKLMDKARKIEKVKNFLLFKAIYEMTSKKDEDTDFTQAYKKYENWGNTYFKKGKVNEIFKDEENKSIINRIRDELYNDYEGANQFKADLKKHYTIINDEIINEIIILFNTKKFDLEIKSIYFFFFEYFPDDVDWNEKFSNKYLNLSQESPEQIKKKLKDLKNIYDYTGQNNYYTLFFRSLYNKKEAIDFIFEKIEQNKNIDDLEEKIQPTNRTINIEDVEATKSCINHMKKIKYEKNNIRRLDYIKGLDPDEINKFERYSKIYNDIIQLDRIDDSSDNIYEQVNKIIKNEFTINIDQDSEEFGYYIDGQAEPEPISMEELIHIKNKIHGDNERQNQKDESEQYKNIKEKIKILEFFKSLIMNLEIINKNMKILRTKGSTLPIKIDIQVQKNKVEYSLGDKKVDFIKIKNFLLNVKNNHISQLNNIYKTSINIRFLYGKQFMSVMKHLEINFHIDSFLRYILNITDNNKAIKEGVKAFTKNASDYINEYKLYNENSLKSISNYIGSVFSNNNIKDVTDHYKKMVLPYNNKYKGIYLHQCKKNTMEKFIIDLFWDKMKELPIAQNVLITSKETSSEEIQSFLHRAILCTQNILFVVEINESFSDIQQSIMNSYLDQLLIYANVKFNEKKNQNTIKSATQSYFYSCLVFIYEEGNKNINSFLKEINKLENQQFEDFNIDKKTYKNDILRLLGNISVYTSEICGLGKSEKIRKLIKTSSKEYFHFPLGGILTKDKIYKKLKNLFKEINNYDYKKVAIHLDLTESEEKSVINEFFFSFLITKFYSSNENIFFIPKDIDIYVEIPNCFENYISNFSVLNIFNPVNITLYKMPDFDYSEKIINLFRRMLNIDSNEKIKQFVKKYIGIEKYSFHQINIFIKLFILPYSKFDDKMSINFFSENKDNMTESRIKDFAQCTQYFTNGGFAKLLTSNKKDEKKDSIDKLSDAYDDDIEKQTFDSQLIFLYPEKNKFKNIKIPGSKSEEYKTSETYLAEIKDTLQIPNEVDKDIGEGDDKLRSLLSILEEKNANYVITNDNYRKMMLLIYRIRANIPVIIMGETGCGKTMLITKLDQLLNNGVKTIEIIDIHPGIDDKKLCKLMEEKDEIAKKRQDKEQWLFFDEINTCLSLSLITEIFINRTYGGKKISDNIRLIGACNPYRKRKGNKEKCGLSMSEDNDNELVYLVQPLPQSLLYYVFSFGRINDEDEKKYIRSIIKKLFTEGEKDLHEYTTQVISKCHQYLRDRFDKSVVSLREIARFTKCVTFFEEYFEKKNKFLKKQEENNQRNNKIRSIICSIYICYYIRLIISDSKDNQRSNFESTIRPLLLKLVNSQDESSKLKELKNLFRKDEDDVKKDKKIKETIDKILEIKLTEKEKIEIDKVKLNDKEVEIATQEFTNEPKQLNPEQIQKLKDEKIRKIKEYKLIQKKYYEDVEEDTVKDFKNSAFKYEIKRRRENIKFFSDFLKIEQDFLIDQIDLGVGIGKNSLLKENVFLLFISVLTNIPLIIIGKPGSGKSLSAQLINKSMKGKYSDKDFFKEFKRIICTYFQGSQSTKPEDVESLFENAEKKLEYYKKQKKQKKDEKIPISMVLFDELGLAERSDTNPLKVLHSKLDYAGKDEDISFVGISNYTLDAAKVNRALILSVPDLDSLKDELKNTAINIVENISPNIINDDIFKILSYTYFSYKEELQNIKELVVLKQYVQSYVPPKKEENINTNEKNGLNSLQIGIKNNLTQNGKKEQSVASDSVKLQNETSNINDDENKIMENWHEIELKQFSDIKREKSFKELMKKETKIRKDFHGNRDFYNLIKGVAYDLGKLIDSTEEEKLLLIIKYIERNFGGIDYAIDINFQFQLQDNSEIVKSLQNILENYSFNNKKGITYLKSVYLFKALYNLQIDEQESILKLKKIDPNQINKYDLNKCIIENIRDNKSRYLLLGVKKELNSLIYQNIKLQNMFKDIILYEGSPFKDDDNKVYRFTQLNKIQEDAKQDKLIIIENLNPIHPFLFDLYNRNFQIINGKKFARICLDNFDEQLTEVNDDFRIIILYEARYLRDCDLAFLNRLEKMLLNFDELLDKKLNIIADGLIEEFNIENSFKKYEKYLDYSLKNLLINCQKADIQGLIYYFSIKERNNEGNDLDNDDSDEQIINEKQIREKVIEKIYKILPQDVIGALNNNNILRKKYINTKKINNFTDYMAEEYKNYKISIIYTYTNMVDGVNNENIILISNIRSESDFKTLIEEIKDKNKYEEKKYIIIQFEQSNSKNIKFITNFILKNFEKDDFYYIIIIRINRNFNKKVNERIYSLPDINKKINIIFIDNLNSSNEINLTDILSNNLQKFLSINKEKLKLDEEFNKTLKNFLKNKIIENNNITRKYIDDEKDENESDENKKNNNNLINEIEYISEMLEYMEEEEKIKEIILEVTYKMIEQYIKNENSNIIDKIYKERLVNNFTIDLVSCIIEYIKENVFNRHLKNTLLLLEDNNILTTLIEIKKNKSKSIDQEKVEKILTTYLEYINFGTNYNYNCKFLYHYNIPGLYNFFENISNYINKKIISNYFNNENYLRKSMPKDSNEEDNIKTKFHKTEESLLDKVYKEMENNYKVEYKIIDIIKDDENDLIFKDYLTFYLKKYRKIPENEKIDDIYYKVITLLLELRFGLNSFDIRDLLLKRIIWIESNVNYILRILNIIDNAKTIFNNKDELLFKKIKEEIYQKDDEKNNIKINYITNDKRNPKITKEVNKCFYILLAGICYCITSDEIQLIQINDDINNNEINIEINHYCHKLKEINKILEVLSDELLIFLNEMYIIDELIKVVQIFENQINIDVIQKIKKHMRENANIIQNYYNNNDINYFHSEIKMNFEETYELIINNFEKSKRNKVYYKNLRDILYSEVKKIGDIDYRCTILEKLLKEDEMIKKSNDIFQMVLKPYLNKKPDKFKDNFKNILNGKDNIIKIIEEENSIVLEETLLYLFEKYSLVYFNYISEKKANFEDEPLTIFGNCVKYLNDYIEAKDKIKSQTKETSKIFCLGYIKSFCFTIIKIRDKNENWGGYKKIFESINDKKNLLNKMIRLYIYKIFYNKDNSVNFFYNENNITKFELNFFVDFKDFIKNKELNNIYKIQFKVPTIKDNFYEDSKEAIERQNNNNFENIVEKTDFDIDSFGIDNFYIATYNYTLSYLQIENTKINNNFYKNVCKGLFQGKPLLAMSILYDQTIMQKFQNNMALIIIILNIFYLDIVFV